MVLVSTQNIFGQRDEKINAIAVKENFFLNFIPQCLHLYISK